ncbi:MAG TPA: RsmD family RNA methyltransferase [Bacteroidia bacterium]|nr:RsmD family RNA methyltransferase [Bacteroidia bacterium]
MRIIGGKLGGRNIIAPASLPVRPTTDYAKSGLFNILSNQLDFEELSVLDLFSGAGGISLEFASREARNVVSVDIHFQCVKYLNETASKFGLTNLKCIRSDVFRFIKQNSQQFNLIFADPPFEQEETDTLPALIFEKNMLKAGGMLIVEHQSNRQLQTPIPLSDIRKYGNCGFSFYKQT